MEDFTANTTLQAGDLSALTISRTVDVVGQLTKYTIGFKSQYAWGDTRGAYVYI